MRGKLLSAQFAYLPRVRLCAVWGPAAFICTCADSAQSQVARLLYKEFPIVFSKRQPPRRLSRDTRLSRERKKTFFGMPRSWSKARWIKPRMEELESRSLLAITTIFGGGVLSFTGNSADDKLVLRATATPSTVEYDDGLGLGFISQAGVTSISFNGGTGDDQLVVYNSNGLVNGLLIGAPITFDCEGGDEDTLSISGVGAGIPATSTATTP